MKAKLKTLLGYVVEMIEMWTIILILVLLMTSAVYLVRQG